MGLKIADLLRWRTSVELKGPDGLTLYEDEKKTKPVTVYLRVIGDQDLQSSYRAARIVSSERRKILRDKESPEFKDQVEPIRDASKEECIELIMTAREQNLNAEAYANTTRSDAVKLDEIAEDPDAPNLEEQEKLDEANSVQDEEFQKALDEYIETRKTEIKAELESKDLKELREIAELEVSNITALGAFLQSVQEYKIIHACYNDKTYKERSFDSIDDWKQTHPIIKEQLLDAYSKLERSTDDIKN